jgi:mitochondrial fission 1 protein
MGTTKNTQKHARVELDNKLALAAPNRDILEELAIACAKTPSPDNTFQYAFCLSKSKEKSELRYSVTILDGLVKEGYEHQVDCMYGSACALYLLGDYDQARVRTFNRKITMAAAAAATINDKKKRRVCALFNHI